MGLIAGGPSNVAAVHACALRNAEDGTFCLEELEEKIKTNPDIHEPYTALICVENTHNMCGGKVINHLFYCKNNRYRTAICYAKPFISEKQINS